MKVILVFLTSYRTEDKFIEVSFEGEEIYPLGVPYIQSYLKSKNHDADFLDLIFIPFDKSRQILINKIESFHPDAIGFSVVTGNHINTFRMMEIIHAMYPKIRIVLGGIHVTIMYEQIIKKYPYVIAVIGEGEITFSELLEDRPLSSINGIAFYSEGKVIKTENRELIKDLDILPFPEHPRLTPKHTMANIITSRGCPSSCSFCVLNPNAKRIRRVRSAKNVVDEIESVLKKHPNIKLIYFMDDSCLTNNKSAIEICNEIIKRKLNYVEYQCQSRIKPFDKKLIPYLEEANFKSLFFGLETANEAMLKSCHKSIRKQDVIDTMTILKDSEMKISLYLMVGLPGETKDAIHETAEFIRKIQKIKYIMYYEHKFLPILLVYPGTEIYEIMKASGKITDDYWLTNNEIPFFTVEHPPEELIELRNELARSIAFMPFHLSKLYTHRGTLIQVINYIIQQYKTKPLMLLKNIIKG